MSKFWFRLDETNTKFITLRMIDNMLEPNHKNKIVKVILTYFLYSSASEKLMYNYVVIFNRSLIDLFTSNDAFTVY